MRITASADQLGLVIVISGPPGAGKSTVSRLIADEFAKSVLISGDDFFRFVRQGHVEPWLTESHDQNATAVAALSAAAREYAAGGYDVVVDAVLGPWFIEPFARGIRDLRYIVLRPTADVTEHRAAARGGDALTAAGPIRQLIAEFADLGSYEGHVLDTSTMSASETAIRILDRLERGEFGLPARERTVGPPAVRSAASAVADLYHAGRAKAVRQAPTVWPRDRWAASLPEHAAFLQALPASLDRDVLRAIGSRATETADAAVEAFLAVMIWGYGSVGYGPFRTHRALTETPEAGQRLWRVARTLAEAGPLPAYERLGRDSRLVGLGPAFGTKYLYFTQPPDATSVALILDRLVARWLDREAGITINPIPWSVRTYRRYLDHMQEWASTLGCRPDDLEYGMFQVMANEFGGQWASSD